MIEEKQLQQEVQVLEKQVNAIVITDKASYEMAGKMVFAIKKYEDEVHAFCDDDIEKANKLHKSLTAKRKILLAPAELFRKILGKKSSDYLTEEEEKRKAEQARLDEERLKQEEAERKKLEARAVRAEESGKLEKAEALREQAEEVYIPPAVVVPEVEKTTKTDTGTISAVNDIEFTIQNPLEVIKAVGQGMLPIAMVEIKEAKLKKYAKDYKLEHIPGCLIKSVKKAQFRNNN